jgi:hypothetical protein
MLSRPGGAPGVDSSQWPSKYAGAARPRESSCYTAAESEDHVCSWRNASPADALRHHAIVPAAKLIQVPEQARIGDRWEPSYFDLGTCPQRMRKARPCVGPWSHPNLGSAFCRGCLRPSTRNASISFPSARTGLAVSSGS